MKSDVVKVAEIERTTALIGAVRDMVTNPVFGLIAGLMIIEKTKWENTSDGTLLGPKIDGKQYARTAVKTVALVEAISPIVPSLLGATVDVVGGISKAVPGAAKLLAGGL